MTLKTALKKIVSNPNFKKIIKDQSSVSLISSTIIDYCKNSEESKMYIKLLETENIILKFYTSDNLTMDSNLIFNTLTKIYAKELVVKSINITLESLNKNYKFKESIQTTNNSKKTTNSQKQTSTQQNKSSLSQKKPKLSTDTENKFKNWQNQRKINEQNYNQNKKSTRESVIKRQVASFDKELIEVEKLLILYKDMPEWKQLFHRKIELTNLKIKMNNNIKNTNSITAKNTSNTSETAIEPKKKKRTNKKKKRTNKKKKSSGISHTRLIKIESKDYDFTFRVNKLYSVEKRGIRRNSVIPIEFTISCNKSDYKKLTATIIISSLSKNSTISTLKQKYVHTINKMSNLYYHKQDVIYVPVNDYQAGNIFKVRIELVCGNIIFGPKIVKEFIFS